MFGDLAYTGQVGNVAGELADFVVTAGGQAEFPRSKSQHTKNVGKQKQEKQEEQRNAKNHDMTPLAFLAISVSILNI